MALVRDDGFGNVAPELPAGFAVETKHDHLVAGVGKFDPENPFGLVLRFRELRIDLAGVDRSGEEHFVAPDDRTGRSVSLDLRFPLQVFLLAPLQRRLRRAGDPVAFRAAPLVPVFGFRLGVSR